MRSFLDGMRLVVPGLLLASSAGCGSSATAPAPAPTPYTEPATLAFVHVLGGGHLATHTVDPTTGLLSRTDVEDVPGSNHFIAADPEGRFVFVDFLPAGEKRPLLRSYLVRPDTGSLDLADQQYSYPAVDLTATDEVVFVSYSNATSHDPYMGLTGFVLHPDGFLEAKVVRDDPGLYMSNFGGLLASAPGGPRLYRTTYGDRTVRALHVQVGKWAVYLEREAGGWMPDGEPKIARQMAAGRLLVTTSSGGWLTTFEPDWDEARLERRTSVQAAGPLLAYAAGVLAAASADGRVEVYAIGAGGELTLKRSTVVSGSPVLSLGFHPSGRFLYVSGATLSTYLVEADGSLRPYQETAAPPGRLVVTPPPPP